jgi:hypothetical protein
MSPFGWGMLLMAVGAVLVIASFVWRSNGYEALLLLVLGLVANFIGGQLVRKARMPPA